MHVFHVRKFAVLLVAIGKRNSVNYALLVKLSKSIPNYVIRPKTITGMRAPDKKKSYVIQKYNFDRVFGFPCLDRYRKTIFIKIFSQITMLQ